MGGFEHDNRPSSQKTEDENGIVIIATTEQLTIERVHDLCKEVPADSTPESLELLIKQWKSELGHEVLLAPDRMDRAKSIQSPLKTKTDDGSDTSITIRIKSFTQNKIELLVVCEVKNVKETLSISFHGKHSDAFLACLGEHGLNQHTVEEILEHAKQVVKSHSQKPRSLPLAASSMLDGLPTYQPLGSWKPPKGKTHGEALQQFTDACRPPTV